MTIGYVFGVICGDGCLDKSDYKIELEAKDKEFVGEFAKRLKMCTNNHVHFYPYERIVLNPSSRKPYLIKLWRCRAGDKKLQLKLQEMKCHLNDSLISLDDENQRLFIRGFYQSEGCYCQYDKRRRLYYIALCNTNLNLLHLIVNLLKKFGIEPTNIYQSRKNSRTWQIRICRQDEISKFFDLIKFPLNARPSGKTAEG